MRQEIQVLQIFRQAHSALLKRLGQYVLLDISNTFDKVWHEGQNIRKLSKNYGRLFNKWTSSKETLLKLYLGIGVLLYIFRVVLAGQVSKWVAVNAGFPLGSILGPLLFLIYINNLSNELSSDPRLFADDSSLFSVVWDTNLSANALNNDLLKTNIRAYQWKMNFNLDPSKQAQEIIFSHKIKKPSYPASIFNNNQAIQTLYEKYLGFFLEEKLNFVEHLRYIANKVNTYIGLLLNLYAKMFTETIIS